MTSQEYIFINVKEKNLQAFFAVLSYVEENSESSTFLCDQSNKLLLDETLKFVKARVVNKMECSKKFRVVDIKINHSAPLTCIVGYFSAPLIFPKRILIDHFKPFSLKIDKIYFRGLFTKKRLIETLLMLINIKDTKAIFILSNNLLKGLKSFKICTKKVFMDFTVRGRQTEFKYLDENYYNEMSNYKYIFCPKGDFEWTYRFFEAVQVGSLPLSKSAIDLYSGFYYLNTFQKPILNFENEVLQNLLIFKSKFHLNKRKGIELS